MQGARSLTERLTLGVLRFAGTLVTLTSFSVALPALVLPALPAAGDFARHAAGGVVRFGAALMVGGVLARYLAASGARLFQGEQPGGGAGREGWPAWRWLFALTLLAIPVGLALQLAPLAAFWRDAIAVLARSHVFDGPPGQFGGIAYIPIVMVLALPTFQVVAAFAFGTGSLFLLVLLANRSRVLTRATLAGTSLLGGFAVAGLLGADTVRSLAPAIERVVRESDPRFAAETTVVLAQMSRYVRVTGSTSNALAWAWTALMVWVPLLILSAQARAGAAADAAAPGGAPPSHEAVAARNAPAPGPSGPDRERFYEQAARIVDARPPGGDPAPAVLIALVLVGAFAAISGVAVVIALGRLITR